MLAGWSSLHAADPPAIRLQGVVNAASQRPAAAGGVVATGSLISLHGVRFAEDPKDNVVRLKTPKGTLALPVLHASLQRLEAWIPQNVPGGPAEVTVRSNGQESSPESMNLVRAGLGLFSANEQGWGQARLKNALDRSVPPGGTVTVLATGLRAGDTPELRIAGRLSKVLSIGFQRPDHMVEITLQVPPETPEGCFVPLYGRVPASPLSNIVTLAVKHDGGPCGRSQDDLFSGWSGGATAIFVLSRTVHRDLGASKDRVEDRLSAGFYDIDIASPIASPFLMAPPRGACTSYATVFDAATPHTASLSTLLLGSLGGEALDEGSSIAINNGRVQVRVPAVIGAPGLYQHILKDSLARSSAPTQLSLDSGTFYVTGSGGKAGRFSVAMAAPTAFTWTNRDRVTALDRPKEVTVQWTGAAPREGTPQSTMAIIASSADTERNVAGLTYCVAGYTAGQFTIPAGLLSQLPVGRGGLLLAFWPTPSRNAAPSGVARPILVSAFVQSAEVEIR
jgi:hypothetical protein